MCNVCDAERALSKTKQGSHARFDHEGHGMPMLVEADGMAPENAPVTFRFKRLNDPDWTKWLNSDDLASSLGSLGTDVSWNYVSVEVKEYIEGGPVEPLLARMAAEEHEVGSPPKLRRSLASMARKRAAQRAAYRKKRMPLFAAFLPGWTVVGNALKFGGWTVSCLPMWAVSGRTKPLNTRVAVKGPLSFSAKMSDALVILRQQGLNVL
jgi:hypothetical protein